MSHETAFCASSTYEAVNTQVWGWKHALHSHTHQRYMIDIVALEHKPSKINTEHTGLSPSPNSNWRWNSGTQRTERKRDIFFLWTSHEDELGDLQCATLMELQPDHWCWSVFTRIAVPKCGITGSGKVFLYRRSRTLKTPCDRNYIWVHYVLLWSKRDISHEQQSSGRATAALKKRLITLNLRRWQWWSRDASFYHDC